MAQTDPAASSVTPDDTAAVTRLLGRVPRGEWAVALRGLDGEPVVIRNAPLLPDGRPMPTEFWLVDSHLNRRIGTLEAEGGVREAERAIGLEVLAALHGDVAERRERDLAGRPELGSARPTGGVGGTRTGVKCLHAHYAHWLVTRADPVGAWVHGHLESRGWVDSSGLPVDTTVAGGIVADRSEESP